MLDKFWFSDRGSPAPHLLNMTSQFELCCSLRSYRLRATTVEEFAAWVTCISLCWMNLKQIELLRPI